MNTDYRYMLETPRVTGRRQQKFQCPQCGRNKCFVRYVDTHNECCYVADEVGRCDHEHSCGYHYKPSEYYRDNAWLKEKVVHSYKPKPLPPPPLKPLPMELVKQSHSTTSIFWQWFTNKCAHQLELDPTIVHQVYEDYCIGATSMSNIIFWQIDEQMRVRTGHIMQYYSDGKRHDGYQNWVHCEKNFKDKVPEGFVLYQCLFGEHLLPLRPEAHVCIVESEKTALIMAAHQPQYLWLATSGSSGLNAEKVECLRGRRFTLFPDSGCLEKWQKIMAGTQGLEYTISVSLEQYPANTDLADLLLQPP